MRCFDYEAVAMDGSVLCVECVPDNIDVESLDPIFADSEWDTYPVCDKCGRVHEYVALI